MITPQDKKIKEAIGILLDFVDDAGSLLDYVDYSREEWDKLDEAIKVLQEEVYKLGEEVD